jgi:ferredoxin-NADP reductase
MSPRVGIAVPDFDNGNVLYVSGTASILVGDEATALLPRTKLAIKVTVASARYVHAGLPFRGVFIEYSPYNPPVRYLLSERAPAATLSGGKSLSAVLSGRQILTPNVARFTFKLTAPLPKGGGWKPGQHVTLDFSEELDMGYSHMADHAPQSINDDFVRTFTVSSALPRDGSGDSGDSGDSSSSTTITPTFDITVRRHGPATNLLWRQPLRVPLEVPVLGFGGKDDFHLPMVNGDAGAVFVAGGVGITPVLAQARLVLDAAVDFRLLWSLRDEDLGLAVDTFTRIDGLAAATTLFVTGAGTDTADLQTVKDMGVRVEQRRVGEEDLQGLRGKGLRFYLCAAPALVKRITTWIEGESVVWEDFGY